MVRRLYLRIYDHRFWRSPAPLWLLGVLALGAFAALPGIRVDLSFRPLFADDPREEQATREFEAVFGQASGAYVGAIVEHPDVLSAAFVRDLALASAAVDSIPGVVEVISLPRLAIPAWTRSGARGELVLPQEILHGSDDALLDARLAELAEAPGIRGHLVSEDGRSALLLARFGLPLDDLEGRREVIHDFRGVLSERLGGTARLRFVGVSVVEAAYARIVLESLARSFLLTTVSLLLVLWLVFRRAAAVAAVMTGVGLAVPATLGILTLLGQDLTMVNSMVPVMILVIGVADGIHMVQAFATRVRGGEEQGSAVRSMFGEMALPCLLTTVTTALGFLALRVAEITAIRDFGGNVAIGVVVAYGFNLVVIPAMLRAIPAGRLVAPVREGRRSAWWSRATVDLVTKRPGSIAGVAVIATVLAAAAVPRLHIDQRFNEEVEASHPVRADQAMLEREFGGFLGPDVSIDRADGSTLLDPESRRRLLAYVEEIRRIPGVLRVETFLNLLPADLSEDAAAAGLAELRSDPLLRQRVRELVDAGGMRAAVMIRTEDLGTLRAHELGDRLERLAAAHMGAEYRVRLVGQWWLAQRGMDHITRDMLASFSTSCLLILPLLALALRRVRLVVVAVLPNVLPMLFALAFMSWTGISLRIGTAMILAIALGIAIDDTIHFLVRLREESSRHDDPREAVRAAIAGVGGALVYTTIVLVLGFLSMLSNDLLAIRDMGMVAAATLTIALLADLILAPALFLLASPRTLLARAGTPLSIDRPRPAADLP